MLIRSQNRETIVNIKAVSAINIFEEEKFLISEESSDFSCTIGAYSTKKKALKVLDMIQEAYAQYEITKASLRDIANLAKEAPDTPESKEIIEAVGKRIIKDMTFQMPEDAEVEMRPINTDEVIRQLEEEVERSSANFEKYANEIGISKDDDWHFCGLRRAIEVIKAAEVKQCID